MLYQLLETKRGKTFVVMTDELPKVNNRKKTLQSGHRKGIKGERVVYKIVAAPDENVKFQKKPHNYNIGGSDQITPPRVSK
jgi:hypothetical protein